MKIFAGVSVKDSVFIDEVTREYSLMYWSEKERVEDKADIGGRNLVSFREFCNRNQLESKGDDDRVFRAFEQVYVMLRKQHGMLLNKDNKSPYSKNIKRESLIELKLAILTVATSTSAKMAAELTWEVEKILTENYERREREPKSIVVTEEWATKETPVGSVLKMDVEYDQISEISHKLKNEKPAHNKILNKINHIGIGNVNNMISRFLVSISEDEYPQI